MSQLLFAIAIQISGNSVSANDSIAAALAVCDRVAFVSLAQSQNDEIAAENGAILEQAERLFARRTALSQRRARAIRSNPIARIFNPEFNEVRIAEEERILEDDFAILSDRRSLVNMRSDLLRSQVISFQNNCRVNK